MLAQVRKGKKPMRGEYMGLQDGGGEGGGRAEETLGG